MRFACVSFPSFLREICGAGEQGACQRSVDVTARDFLSVHPIAEPGGRGRDACGLRDHLECEGAARTCDTANAIDLGEAPILRLE